MKSIVCLILLAFSFAAFAIPCDCEVRVYGPMTGSEKMESYQLKLYELEDYSTYSIKNQRTCRKLCEQEFEEKLPVSKLKEELLKYTETLVQERAVGFNCTGLTTLKYPVRVKASLGEMGLGNVSDTIQVINYEKPCF